MNNVKNEPAILDDENEYTAEQQLHCIITNPDAGIRMEDLEVDWLTPLKLRAGIKRWDTFLRIPWSLKNVSPA